MDEYGRSPLHYVCIDNPKEDWDSISKRLIAEKHDINAKDKCGWTPLHFAAQEGGFLVVKRLIESGVEINTKNDQGNTPLWIATMNSHNDIVELLVESGSNPDEKNNHGVSAMDIEPDLFKKKT